MSYKDLANSFYIFAITLSTSWNFRLPQRAQCVARRMDARTSATHQKRKRDEDDEIRTHKIRAPSRVALFLFVHHTTLIMGKGSTFGGPGAGMCLLLGYLVVESS